MTSPGYAIKELLCMCCLITIKSVLNGHTLRMVITMQIFKQSLLEGIYSVGLDYKHEK